MPNAYWQLNANHMAVKSLALIGNASGRVSYSGISALLLPRGIFDKETRRKAVAVGGAAMELEWRIGLRKSVRKLADPVGIRRKG